MLSFLYLRNYSSNLSDGYPLPYSAILEFGLALRDAVVKG